MLSAALLFCVGLLASVFAWYMLRYVEQLDLSRETASAASDLAMGIGDAFNQEIEALRRRNLAWTTSGATGPVFYREATTFLQERPAFSAVARVEAGQIDEIVGPAEAGVALRTLAADAQDVDGGGPKTSSERFVGPVELENGESRFGVQIPLAEPVEDAAPALFAVLNPHAAVARWLGRRELDFDVRVQVGSVPIYGPAIAAPDPSFTVSEPIAVTLGEPWVVDVSPTAATLERFHGEAPKIVLLSGFVISALMSSLVHVGNLSRLRARVLQRTNVALYEKVESTQRGESEIRLLNESLEKRVEERTAALNETIAELETFNYSVSHDLRSPLGAIINFAAILKEDYEPIIDEAGREHFDRLLSSAHSAVALMDGLLAFSRSGREAIHRELVRMRTVAEGVVRELDASAPLGACSVNFGPLPDAWADAGMMRIVWLNLIQNACKFAPPGEAACVEIGGSARQDEVEYFVRDKGVGFDMRFADKLFKPFERLHPTERASGSGVGLAIVARIVHRHGGRLDAQGAVGKGATFSFTLPIRSEVTG